MVGQQPDTVHPIAGQIIRLLEQVDDSAPMLTMSAAAKVKSLLVAEVRKGDGESAVVEVSKLAYFLRETYQAAEACTSLLAVADEVVRENKLVSKNAEAFQKDALDESSRHQEYERLLGVHQVKKAPQFNEEKPEGTLRVDQLNTKFRRI